MNDRLSAVALVLGILVYSQHCSASRISAGSVQLEAGHNGERQRVFHRGLFQSVRARAAFVQPETGPRVVHGVDAKEGRHPYMCAIYTGGSTQNFACGGFLIHPRWVMTAAHCVSPRMPAHNAIVICGLYRNASVFDEKKGVNAIKTYIPEEYLQHEDILKGSDIALLELEEPYNDLAVPILDLSYTCGLMNGQRFSALGFGYKSEDEPVAEVLQHAPELDFVPRKRCRKQYPSAGKMRTQICAGLGRQDTCKGDSGGPLLIPHRVKGKYEDGDPSQDVIVGVVSFGPEECGSGTQPGVYTSVNSYTAWIMDTTKQDVQLHMPICVEESLATGTCPLNRERQKALLKKFREKSNAARVAALDKGLQRDDCNLVEVMMELNVSADTAIRDMPLLHWAASLNASASMQVLLDRGADLEAKDPAGNTALQYSAYFGNLTTLQILLEAGADPDSQNNEGYAAIHRASLDGHESAVKELIKADADVDIQTNEGWTALHLAARNGIFRIVKLLVKNGADPKLKQSDGWTPMDVICRVPCTPKQRTQTRKHLE